MNEATSQIVGKSGQNIEVKDFVVDMYLPLQNN
jgi:hypothetical protein